MANAILACTMESDVIVHPFGNPSSLSSSFLYVYVWFAFYICVSGVSSFYSVTYQFIKLISKQSHK